MSFKRNIKIWYLRFLKIVRNNDKKVRRPFLMTDAEITSTEIFIKTLKESGSKLYYDLETRECYVKSEDSTLFIFLEHRNVKIINSVYGYDVNISAQLEMFLTDRFRREMSIRRKNFKEEALRKIEHSLEATLEKIKNRNL